MTTNRMGLEQTLSDERLELFISQPLDNGLTRGEQMELARELLAYRKASNEPVGYLFASKHGCVSYSISPESIEGFTSIGAVYAATPLQGVTVPDEVTVSLEVIANGYQLTVEQAEGYRWGFNACRAVMLKNDK